MVPFGVGTHGLGCVGPGEVGGEPGGRAGQGLGEVGEQLAASGDEDELDAGLTSETPRGAGPDPARGAGDEGDLRLSAWRNPKALAQDPPH